MKDGVFLAWFLGLGWETGVLYPCWQDILAFPRPDGERFFFAPIEDEL